MTATASHASPADTAGEHPLLELRGLCKRYPGVEALRDVDFDLRPGEVHVLFGENGAGKSTLIGLVSGAQRPSSGTIRVGGKAVEFDSVQQARASGINAVYQEFSLVPQLTVAENIFLGEEEKWLGLTSRSRTRRQAQDILDRLGFPLRADSQVAYLSRAEQQMVEIAKVFRAPPTILILDEPTASLTERETDRLFALIAAAKGDGVGVIYITHRMGEIRRIGDRLTVLRDGRKIATVAAGEVSDERLIELMTGRVIDQVFPSIGHRPADIRLEVDDLTTRRQTVRKVSIAVRGGEVVGLAGLVGSGKGDVGRACFGLEKLRQGKIRLDGEDVTRAPVRDLIRRGLYYLPSDRRGEGLILNRSARENIALANLFQPHLSARGWIKLAAEGELAADLSRRVDLRPPNLEKQVEQFSGGNQQKIMIAKALASKARVVIFDEPTVGVDVGTRAAIYAMMRDLCEAGVAILLISSDLPEILHLAHRAYVMYRGELRAELAGEEISQEGVLGHFFERGIND